MLIFHGVWDGARFHPWAESVGFRLFPGMKVRVTGQRASRLRHPSKRSSRKNGRIGYGIWAKRSKAVALLLLLRPAEAKNAMLRPLGDPPFPKDDRRSFRLSSEGIRGCWSVGTG
ncbi:MAG TPA: hypothetical protein PKJ51_00250 [Methanothrix sp.]|nr:hypothetical protein [Methanothrix sp.]